MEQWLSVQHFGVTFQIVIVYIMIEKEISVLPKAVKSKCGNSYNVHHTLHDLAKESITYNLLDTLAHSYLNCNTYPYFYVAALSHLGLICALMHVNITSSFYCFAHISIS